MITTGTVTRVPSFVSIKPKMQHKRNYHLSVIKFAGKFNTALYELLILPAYAINDQLIREPPV
jgi:hypothetical protein